MSNVFTLDSLREELENEFAPLRIQHKGGEYVLRSLLRIDKEKRSEVVEHLKALETGESKEVDEDAVLEAARVVIRTVTEGGKGDRLLKDLGDDLLLHMKIIERWAASTQPGEVQVSPN